MVQPLRYRSAITGQFVSSEYAKRHPKTTVAEGGHRVRTRPGKKK